MINRNHLALFRAVAEAGGFSHAAAAVHVSQPAISMQVAELESALGTMLFDRLPRGVRLTPAGEILFGYAQRIAALERDAERAMDELRGLRRGRLALGASATVGSYLLPAVLGDFRRRHPAVELTLTVDNTAGIRQRLLDGTLDLGLTEGTRPEDSELAVEVFAEDELVIITAPDHPLAARSQPVAVSRLCAEPMILREPGSGTRAVFERALAAHGAAVTNVALVLNSPEAIKRAVAAGLGLAAVSRLCVESELAGGTLVTVPVHGLEMGRPLYALTLRGRRSSASVAAFLPLLPTLAVDSSRRGKQSR